MQLRNARLCLDCDEVHDELHCPTCASESFAFIKRWVPASEKRPRRPDVAPATRETVDTYKELLSGNAESRLTTWQLVRGGAMSLALLGAAGWVWRRNGSPQPKSEMPPASNGGAAD